MPDERDARVETETSGPASRRRRYVLFALIAALSVAVLFAVSVATLPLSGTNVRAEVEARLQALSGQEVFVDGTVTYSFLPQPRMVLGDVRMGGAGSGPVLLVDQVHAEFDVVDALFGHMDLERLVLVRPELEFFDTASGHARSIGAANDPETAEHRLLAELRSLMERFEGVRAVEFRDGLFRTGEDAAEFSSVDAVLTWPSATEPARASGAFVWNGQRTEFGARAERLDRFLEGGTSPVELSVSAQPIEMALRGEASAGEAIGFDGLVNLSAPSLPRVARWLGDRGTGLPDLGPVALSAGVATAGERTAFREVRVGVGDQTGEGVLEAVLSPEGRPSISGTLAFPRLDLDRFTRGIAPLPRHALDFQRPMTIAFARAFDLDLRLSAAEAGLGGMPLRQLAASVMFFGQRAKLDVSDAELLGGRAQASLTIDFAGPRPMAVGRIDLRSVDAAGIGTVAGLGALALSGRADLSAQFEAPATNWAEILRDNVSTVDIGLVDGSLAGFSRELFRNASQSPLGLGTGGASTRFESLVATLGTRGPYATLDALRMTGTQGTLEAGGFLSLLDDRIFVEGSFEPRPGDDLFTSSQPVPFRMEGEWPNPTLTVGSSLGITPI